MRPIGGRTGTALYTSSPVAAGELRPLWVGRPASSQSCCPGGHKHVTSPGPRLFSQLGVRLSAYVSSQRLWLLKLSVRCGRVACLEEIRHTDVKIA